MQQKSTVDSNRPLPGRVAVLGAAGGLGQGVLSVCRDEKIAFTAIVRSRPERIGDVPQSSHVAVVTSLSDRAALTQAFKDAETIISAVGVTSSSNESSALLSTNMDTIEVAMNTAGVNRILLINTLVAAPPGESASGLMRFFSKMPGIIGKGAREQQAVIDALGRGALSSINWTLVRAAVNIKGKDEPPVAAERYNKALNSWWPVSYQAMGRWMLEESVANQFIRAAPTVSRRRR